MLCVSVVFFFEVSKGYSASALQASADAIFAGLKKAAKKKGTGGGGGKRKSKKGTADEGNEWDATLSEPGVLLQCKHCSVLGFGDNP